MLDVHKTPADATRSRVKSLSKPDDLVEPINALPTQRSRSSHERKKTTISGAYRTSEEHSAITKRTVSQAKRPPPCTDLDQPNELSEHDTSDGEYELSSSESGPKTTEKASQSALPRSAARPIANNSILTTERTISVTVASKTKRLVNPNSKRQQLLKKDKYIKKLKTKLREQYEKVAELKVRVGEGNNKMEELEEKLVETTERFNVAHAGAMKLLKKSTVTAEPDNVVRAEFETIMGMCKTWARKYAISSFDGLSREQFVTAVNLISSDPNSKAIFASGYAKKGMQERRLSPVTILNSVLARIVCKNTFQRPFFYLGNIGINSVWAKDGEAEGPGFHLEKALTWVLEHSETTLGEKSNMWRGLTARTLDPGNCAAQSTAEKKRADKISGMKDAVYTVCVQIIEKVCKVLCSSVSGKELEKRQCDLERIFRRAGDLASKVATQNVKIQVLFYSDLKRFVNNKFTNGSDLMDPHHSMHCEEEDVSWNGCALDLVVQPLILAWGDEHGENYDRYKVWSKAVVWLGLNHSNSASRAKAAAKPVKASSKPSGEKVERPKDTIEAEVDLNNDGAGGKHSPTARPRKIQQPTTGTAARTISSAETQETDTQPTTTVDAATTSPAPTLEATKKQVITLPSLISSHNATSSTGANTTDERPFKDNGNPARLQSENNGKTHSPKATAAAELVDSVNRRKRDQSTQQDPSIRDKSPKRPRSVSLITLPEEEVVASDSVVKENAKILKEQEAEWKRLKQGKAQAEVVDISD